MVREVYKVNPTSKSEEWTQEEFQRVSHFLERLTGAKPEYQGEYVSGECYEEGDIVVHDGYQVIANKPTCEYPTPYAVGSQTWLLPQVPVWTPLQVTNIVYTGVVISNLTKWYQIQAYRIWIENITEAQKYRLYSVDIAADVWTALTSIIPGDVLSAKGWLEVNVNPVWVGPGSEVGFILAQQNSSGTTDYNHPWVYQGVSNQENDPGIYNANRRGDHAQLRINATDRDDVDRHAELTTVVAGTLIKVTSEADLSRYIQYEVRAYVDNTTWVNYSVVLIDTGAAGEPQTGEDVQIYFEVPIATPTDYVELTDGLLSYNAAQGFKQIGEGAAEFNENGYAVDIEVQEFQRSDDWDILSSSQSTATASNQAVYDYVKVNNIIDIPETYTQVAELITSDAPASVYELKFTLTWSLSVANKSTYMRWRETDEQGVFSGWNDLIIEPKDTTDVSLMSYFYPVEWEGGSKTIQFEMRKEDALGQLDLLFLDLIYDQKI